MSANHAPHFFTKFSTEDSLKVIRPFGTTATAIRFDATEKAALVVPTTAGGHESGSIEFVPTGPVDCREYPVFGIRLKLKNPNSVFGRFYWRTDAVQELREKLMTAGATIDCWQFIRSAQPKYEATTDWQIAYVDFTNMHNPYFKGNWLITMMTMLDINGKGVTTDDGIYIDWMGFFPTVADVYAYAGVKWTDTRPKLYEGITDIERRAMESSLKINNNVQGDLPKLSSEKVLISDYQPEMAFKHHPGIAYFKGKLYASFSNGALHEDLPGQKMVYCISDDFYHWSEPIDICVPGVTPGTESVHTDARTSIIGGFSQREDALYFAYTVTDYKPECFDENGEFILHGSRNATYTDWLMRSDDGIHWSEPIRAGSSSFSSNHGRSPFGTNRYFHFYGKVATLSDDGHNWRTTRATDEQIAASNARCPGQLTESSGYQSPDGVVHNLIRSESGYVWQNESYDNGETWTEFYPTNFTTASTMFKCLYLKDGRIVWIGSPYYDIRWPLTLYVSEDGYNFNKGYILRDEVYQMQKDGYAKGGQFAYPHITTVDGYLYILYSKQKEVMEITRIKLSDL